MRVKAITGFDHGGRTYSAGEEFEVSEPTAKELADKGLVERVDDAASKSAPTPHNKMAPDHAAKRDTWPGTTDSAASSGITGSRTNAAPKSPENNAGDNAPKPHAKK